MTKEKAADEATSEMSLSAFQELRNQRRNDAGILALVIVGFLAALVVLWIAPDLATSLARDKYYYGGNDDGRLQTIASTTVWIRISISFFLVVLAGFVTYLIASGSTIFKTLKMRAAAGVSLSEDTLEAALKEIKEAANSIARNRIITDADRAAISAQLEEIVKTSLPKEYLAGI